MTRYADPDRCPDCRHEVPVEAASCTQCGLPLRGPTAQRLFWTLTQADELLAALRDETAPAPRTVPVEGSTRGRGPTAGLSAASVPKILLGLGAGCLLVAALVFLAVTWSVMGVGGRTATLVGFTLVAAALTVVLARRELRAAGESLAVVTLGLLILDLAGARIAGWLGEVSDPGFTALVGAVLAAAGAAASLGARRTPLRFLRGAEAVSTLGLAGVVAGLVTGPWLVTSAGLVGCVLLAATGTVVVHRLGLAVATVGNAAVSAVTWLALTLSSLERALDHAAIGDLWWRFEGWPLLVAAAAAGAVAVVRRLPLSARLAGLAVGQVLLAVFLVLPSTLGTLTEATLVVLAVLVAAAVATWTVPRPWSWACATPLCVAATWMSGVAVVLAEGAAERAVEAGSALWSGAASATLPALPGAPAPWLLPVCGVALLGTGVVLARSVPGVDPVFAPLADAPVAAAVLTATLAGTVLLYPSPVWLVVAVLLVAAVGNVGWAFAGGRHPALVAGALFAVGGLLVALADQGLTAVVLTTAAALAAVVHLRWRRLVGAVTAGVVLTATVAGSVWTWGRLLDADPRWAVLFGIALLGALVLASRAPSGAGVEMGALGSGALLAAAAATATYPLPASWVAGYLTLAGVTASAHALLRPDRRRVGWLGGLLLAAATWVRLADAGVEVVEAYTLPSALALTVVGVVHLRRHRRSSTMRALSGGLGLGLAPSLLVALEQPGTTRAVLLGLACLGLLVLGLRLRWTAPVILGAGAGALLVLRHVAPVHDAVPQWLLLGAAGGVLIGLGVTWERRLHEARALVGYVRALR